MCPTFRDTAVYRLPIWLFGATVGRILSRKEAADDDESADEYEDEATGPAVDDDDSEPGKATPSTDSNEEFELLEKSTDSLGQAMTTCSQPANKNKSNKRKGRKKCGKEPKALPFLSSPPRASVVWAGR